MRVNLDLVEFSESVMSVFREQDKGKEYIFVSTEKHLPYSADAVKLESILNNLSSNASKYTSEGDSIILSVGRDEARGLVVLKLTHTGTGISADELPVDAVFRLTHEAKHVVGNVFGSDAQLPAYVVLAKLLQEFIHCFILSYQHTEINKYIRVFCLRSHRIRIENCKLERKPARNIGAKLVSL